MGNDQSNASSSTAGGPRPILVDANFLYDRAPTPTMMVEADSDDDGYDDSEEHSSVVAEQPAAAAAAAAKESAESYRLRAHSTGTSFLSLHSAFSARTGTGSSNEYDDGNDNEEGNNDADAVTCAACNPSRRPSFLASASGSNLRASNSNIKNDRNNSSNSGSNSGSKPHRKKRECATIVASILSATHADSYDDFDSAAHAYFMTGLAPSSSSLSSKRGYNMGAAYPSSSTSTSSQMHSRSDFAVFYDTTTGTGNHNHGHNGHDHNGHHNRNGKSLNDLLLPPIKA